MLTPARLLVTVAALALTGCNSPGSLRTVQVSGTLSSASTSSPVDFTGSTVSVAGIATSVTGSGTASYAVANVPSPGTYSVIATVPGSREGILQAVVNVDQPAVVNFTFTPIIRPSGSVAGKVTGLASFADVLISVPGRVAAPDPVTGQFSLSSLLPGTYVLTATCPSSVERSRSFTVTVGSGGTAVPDIVFSPAAVTLSGIVQKYPESATAGVSVSLSGQAGVAGVTSDASGIFSFLGVTGGSTYTLTFSSGGYSESLPGVTFQPLVGTFVLGGGAVFNLAQSPFELQAGRHIVPSPDASSSPWLEAVSNDAALIAYSVAHGAGRTLFVKRTTDDSPPAEVVAEFGGYARFSPDGSWIALQVPSPGTYDDDLAAAPVPGPGGTVVPAVVLKNVNWGQWEFSPFAGASPTLYGFSAGPPRDGSALGSGLYEVAAQGGAILNSFTTANSSFRFKLLSNLKTGGASAPRILFLTGAAAPFTLVSAPCTGAAVGSGSLVSIDATLGVPSPIVYVSPDQSFLAYVNGGLRGGSSSAPSAMLDSFATSVSALTFSPFGPQMAFVDYSEGYGLYSRDLSPSSTSVYLGWDPIVGHDGSPASFMADGSIVYVVREYYVSPNFYPELVVSSPDGSNRVSVKPFPVDYLVTPDGGKIVYTAADASAGAFAPTSLVDCFSRPAAGPDVTVATGIEGISSVTADSLRLILETRFDIPVGVVDLGFAPVNGSAPVTPIAQGVRPETVVLQPDAATSSIAFLASDGYDGWAGSEVYGTRVHSFRTGVTTPLVGRAEVWQWLHSSVPGATPDRILTQRTGSPAPYSFQDGFYVSNVP